MLHDVGNNRDCDVDVDHRNNTNGNADMEKTYSGCWTNAAARHHMTCMVFSSVVLLYVVTELL